MKMNPMQTVLRVLAVFGFVAVLQNAPAQFTFPVYEPFSEYSEVATTNLALGAGSSAAFWEFGNSASGSSAQMRTIAALSYPGLPGDPNTPAAGIQSYNAGGGSGTGKNRAATFTTQALDPSTNRAIYASFLLNVVSNNSVTANRLFFALSTASSGSSGAAADAGVWLTPAGSLLISKNSSTTPATNATFPLVNGGTYLVVLRYQSNGTNQPAGVTNIDQVDLWLNPTSLGNNTAIPNPNLTTTNGANSRTFSSMAYESPATGGPTNNFYMDEIRVGTNWAQVTPTGPAPGPIFNVTGGGSGCPGDLFVVGLDGSAANNNYFLYVNGTYSGQSMAGTGSAISFGPQGTSGSYGVLASNIVSGNVGWMNTNATVSVLAGPVIVTQPVPVLVATNGYATFSVAATGNALQYQWYKNGVGLSNGGEISGAQSPTLTISPATTADAATSANGYTVIITNSCGLSAASSPAVSLTLDQPANLVWQGANPNLSWDLATTANWTNLTGVTEVFNAGDNVTFDDSSTNQVVTLAGNLAPSIVTVNSGKNYIFQGGSITGPGSLIKNGSGILSNTVANTYTGGTLISGGSLMVKDPTQSSLGSGLATLNGGTLEIASGSGSVNVGVSNNLNVAVNSTIQYDASGTEAFNFFGMLTNASSSTTLTIYHPLNNTSAADRMRLYGNFTNNLSIVLSTTGNEIEFAPYNPTGSQVYNGVFSGNGGRIIPRGAGTVILNGANTFNDNAVQNNGNGPSFYSLLLSGSTVGLGLDSSLDFSAASPVSIAGGSSPAGTAGIGIDVTAGNDTLFASGAAHTVANPISYTSATNSPLLIFSGNNNLTLSGAFTLSGADGTGSTNRVIQVNNTALTTLSGVIGDMGLNCGITKTGTNTLVLSAPNTYTGVTTVGAGALWVNGQVNTGGVTVTNGSLGGSGSILGPVSVQSPGALAPGTASIGTLTINSTLTMAGNAVFKVNKSLSPGQSNDIANVTGTLSSTGTGTVTVNNLGPALAVGDTFFLFNKAVPGGNTLVVTGGGMNWNNNLASDGSIQAASVVSTVNTNATNIVFSLTGNVLKLSWPADHIGWRLLVQTNHLSTGISQNTNDWGTVAGSVSVDQTNITINASLPTEFYRLVYP